MTKRESIIVLNVPLLSSVHERILEIKEELHAVNLSLTLQRIVTDWHAKPEAT
jgi:hypothetical protein